MEQTKFVDKLIPAIMKFVNQKGIIALKDGIMTTLPLSLVGSLFLLFAQLPIPAFNDWVASILGPAWIMPLLQMFNATMGIMGMVAVMGIAYCYAKAEGHEPFAAAVIGLVVFIGTLNLSVPNPLDPTKTVGGVINMGWLGGKGMVTAIIIGLVVGYTYSWFMAKKITIKMPESVPQGVANAFSALIPTVVIATGAMVVNIIFAQMNTTFIEFIYKVLQTPLQGATDSLPGIILISFAVPFLWWFGVHGASIVGGVVGSILTANMLDNGELLLKTGSLTVAGGAHIVTQQFVENYVQVTGSGITIGLVISMLLAGKSAQSKALGKLSIVPALFNINEPVIFGFPVVMNPFMFVPFIGVPVISALVTYLSISTGLVEPFTGVLVPWTTPPVISGFLVGGWKAALLQVVVLAISVVGYYPFFKKQEAINLANEAEYNTEHEIS